jgi:hypothetical protein
VLVHHLGTQVAHFIGCPCIQISQPESLRVLSTLRASEDLDYSLVAPRPMELPR